MSSLGCPQRTSGRGVRVYMREEEESGLWIMPTHWEAERGSQRDKDENPWGENRLMLPWLQKPYGLWSLSEKTRFPCRKASATFEKTNLFGLAILVCKIWRWHWLKHVHSSNENISKCVLFQHLHTCLASSSPLINSLLRPWTKLSWIKGG